MSIENVSSGLVPQAEKTDSSHQGLEFLFSPLLEEYYNPTHGQAEENNNDQAPNASLQEDEFINPFCTRVQEIGEPSSRNIDNTDVHSFQPQSHDYRWTRDHPLEQVCRNPKPCSVETDDMLATDHEMKGSLDPYHSEKLFFSGKLCMDVKHAQEPGMMNYQTPDVQDGFTKAFSDADHAGCIDTRKSTSGGIQFLGDKLESNPMIPTRRTGGSTQGYPKLEIAVLSFKDKDFRNLSFEAFKIGHNMRMLVKDTRSQDGKDDKDNDKGSKSRSQSMKEQAYNKEQRERPRPHELNDKSNLIVSWEGSFINEYHLGEIV
ncbi:hypothetical protein Tco_1540514 [Tanacetum coccineum]